MKKITLFLFIINCFLSFSQTTHNISDPADIESLTLSPGDIVVLADGVYTSDERIDFVANGTADNPITFTPASPGGVQFTGGLQMNIAGSYLIIDGFYWNGGYGASNFIQFRNGTDYATNCTIQNCAINGLIADPTDAAEAAASGSIIKHRWIVLYGNYNSVLNCTFMNKNTAGALVLAEYAYNATPDEGITNTRCDEVGHTISNNYFYNYEKMDASLSNSGDSETIRIGTSEYQNVNSAAMVSNNYFVQADGENEIITNKSMNNSYFNNTFRRCRGSLVMRHGSNATVDGNYFLGENVEGTGGIRIADSDHNITNNYIQDCVSTVEFDAWNNGLTFVGGNTSSVSDCNSTSVSNAYQDVDNINFSNNTIINTESPFYFNDSRDGSDNVYGTVSNNLVYFDDGNANITNVIMDAYNEIGSTLTFSGNIFDGTDLGFTASGFTETTITVTADGEIFSHDQTGIGAVISDAPITDDMVGYGVGACFLDYEANFISDPDCTVIVEEVETLNVSTVSQLTYDAQSTTVTVTANVSWEAVSNSDWISIDTTSGTDTADVVITVTENTNTSTRSGSVTFTQVDGDIEKVLTISQAGPELTDLYTLINTGGSDDPVSIFEYSDQEVNDVDKFNYASNTLDKDNTTVWAADDNEGDGEYIIYDLGSGFALDLIQFTTTNKTDPFAYQILVSTDGTDDADFTLILPTSGSYILSDTGTTDFNQYEVSADARYVKILGYGRTDSTGTTSTSIWSALGEVEFYGEPTILSNDNFQVSSELSIQLYPNPVVNELNVITSNSEFNKIKVYSLLGNTVLTSEVSINNTLDVSQLSPGVYFVEISNGSERTVKKIVITK